MPSGTDRAGIALSLIVAGALGLSAPAWAQDAATPGPDQAVFVVNGETFTGDPVAGEKVFKQCQQCHTIKAGQNRVGPTLYGIIGRTAGTVEGFAYSKANKESGKVWEPQVIFDYLENPRKTIPGTKMAFVGLKKPQDRADVLAYIEANSKE